MSNSKGNLNVTSILVRKQPLTSIFRALSYTRGPDDAEFSHLPQVHHRGGGGGGPFAKLTPAQKSQKHLVKRRRRRPNPQIGCADVSGAFTPSRTSAPHGCKMGP